jgi:hypothetical protein
MLVIRGTLRNTRNRTTLVVSLALFAVGSQTQPTNGRRNRFVALPPSAASKKLTAPQNWRKRVGVEPTIAIAR